MKNRVAGVTTAFVAAFIFCALMIGNPRSGNIQAAAVNGGQPVLTAAAPDCSDCEDRCQDWIKKCKEGGQYPCYKAAACLCKCNLDEGGCGSSKEALRECYEQNEKLARELGPSAER